MLKIIEQFDMNSSVSFFDTAPSHELCKNFDLHSNKINESLAEITFVRSKKLFEKAKTGECTKKYLDRHRFIETAIRLVWELFPADASANWPYKKIQKTGVRNIKAMVVDVTQTTLEDESVDHTFFFGVIHSLMNILDDTLKEMHRILKFEGTLVIQKSRKSTADIINLVTTKGMFKLLEEKKRILIFQKC